MRFYVADTLTGQLVGRLEPYRWEVTDPLLTPGTGSLSVLLPDDQAGVARLRDLTMPRRRWVAAQDDDGAFVWCGPIPRRPAKAGNTVTVPLVDWRSWFYRAPLRPVSATARYTLKRTGVEQATIMRQLIVHALTVNVTGAPRMLAEVAPVTGVNRDLTAEQLDRSIGDLLDSMVARDRAPEWHVTVDVDPADPLKLLPRVVIYWPERRLRVQPIRVEYRTGQGGNATDYTWPEGAEAATRAWAVGDGEPPAQVWASDELPGVKTGDEVAWEETLGPLDGVVKRGTAFDHAYAAVQRGRGADGLAEFTLKPGGAAGAIRPGLFTTGDRARIILRDGWDDADVPAARITSRTLSGGARLPTVQRITVDLADAHYPDQGATPGVEATD